MNPPQNIYALISFSQSHIDGWEKMRKDEADYMKLVEGMSRQERKEFHTKWRKENPHVPETRINLGKAYRGCFLDRDELIALIEQEDSPYGLCECYYEYLLIEKRTIGEIDDVCWGDQEDAETWFKLENNDNGSIKYVRIDKPECFKQTCNFL
jgi:hypothetical protein